ncbi:hypothetical protein OG900_33475 [Streptomyces sp. NBC_00433]
MYTRLSFDTPSAPAQPEPGRRPLLAKETRMDRDDWLYLLRIIATFTAIGRNLTSRQPRKR